MGEEIFKELLAELKEQIKKEVLAELQEVENKKPQPSTEKRYAYKQKGLAEYLGCSVSTITRWLASGALDGCKIQHGRTLVFDLNKLDAKMSNGGFRYGKQKG